MENDLFFDNLKVQNSFDKILQNSFHFELNERKHELKVSKYLFIFVDSNTIYRSNLTVK